MVVVEEEWRLAVGKCDCGERKGKEVGSDGKCYCGDIWGGKEMGEDGNCLW